MNAPQSLQTLVEASPDLKRSLRQAAALRVLAADAVEQARSGHPGAPLGMADMATALWAHHLRHNPVDPHWPDRDRFVLSNGHASMLLYALLHLSGYDLPVTELQRFRQFGSKTPGHPEVGVTPGVETTTGPLGQGLANAVGMAFAERLLAAEFNRDGHAIVDHRTWVFVGDGCLMEGLSQEAISLAGTLRLRKLIALYDDNGISIDGAVAGWFTDDTPARFRACGWNVIGPIDGHDPVALDVALRRAQWNSQAEGGGPTLIVCRTEIGHGVPSKAGSHEVHGAPLGAAGIKELRAQLGWTEPPFVIPDDAAQAWDARERGVALQSEWARRFASYRNAHPELAAEFTRRMDREAPSGHADAVDALLVGLAEQARPVATRRASQLALDAIAPLLPGLFGGSADLTGSNLTDFKGHRVAGRDRSGNYLSWGVREFGMAAAMNGMALHGGLIPYGGTFLTFSDYSRNAIRMAALMNLRVIHVFSHDSIALGEDGPTHQPIEHVSALRLIPNLDVWRPADTLETAVAWAHALARSDGPSALILSRQALPVVAKASQRDQIARGGYVLADVAAGVTAQAGIIATGSEVQLALAAQKLLADDGIQVRVVAMPSTSVFDRQGAEWRKAVLPAGMPLVAVEAGHPDLWHKYVGRDGAVIGIARFGESAPVAELMAHFGFVAERVAEQVRRLIAAG